MYGTKLELAGSAEQLSKELAQAELFYIRSPGYDGADSIQVRAFVVCLCLVYVGIGRQVSDDSQGVVASCWGHRCNAIGVFTNEVFRLSVGDA